MIVTGPLSAGVRLIQRRANNTTMALTRQVRLNYAGAVALASGLLLAACGGEEDSTASASASAPAPVPSPSPAPATTSATLNWSTPSVNDDGSPLSGITGYRIRYGTSPTQLTNSFDVAGSDATRYTVANLPAATYYFSVSTLTSSGAVSQTSGTVSVSLR
jgi:hypothetical protein